MPASLGNPSTCGAYGGSPSTRNYAWSADGHLASIAITSTYNGIQTTTTESAHWDGDDVLYVSYAGTGGLLSLYIEKLGIAQWSPGGAGLMVYDRDQSGTSINNHWGGGGDIEFSQLNVDNVHPQQHVNCNTHWTPGNQSPTNSCSPSSIIAGASLGGPSDASSTDENTTWGDTVPLDATRQDGYFDGSISIQGVRAYDPNMNQWTTPDAYSGEVHDPMSQHPYMWNGNNPVQYQDPSGYDPNWAFIDPIVGPLPHLVSDTVHDVRTVSDSHAAKTDRVVAAVSLAATLVGDPEGGPIVKAAAKLGIEDLIKAAVGRFGAEAAANGLTAGSERLVIQSAEKVKIQYRDGSGVRRDVMAHNAHANEPGTTAHTQTATKGRTDAGSHQPIP